ncbi:uncharacterized protein VP01_949g1 [Puccinia sorghi]|uniref:Uncharacterized protein n=1 Tax=Puccinia sorghi TaxID=27349 RepID=A0A0L6U6G4_9BASI|nr:uncharacterized protein VP01_949g1 [Puccinia sorghi]
MLYFSVQDDDWTDHPVMSLSPATSTTAAMIRLQSLSLLRTARAGRGGGFRNSLMTPNLILRRSRQDDATHDPSKYQSIASNVKDITQSARQEAKNNLGTVVDAVSGLKGTTTDRPSQFNPSKHGNIGENTTGNDSQNSVIVSSLTSMFRLVQEVPRGALIFGTAGLVPYFATSFTTVYLARQAFLADRGFRRLYFLFSPFLLEVLLALHDPAKFDVDTALTLLYHNENLQVTYGAVILSALGTIHWGIDFAFRGMQADQAGQPKGTERYWLGAFPVALAWPTLLLPNHLALASQWAAFTMVWYADMLATSWGWTPRWYSTYRFGLTAIVGSSLLVTLGASSYWSLDDVEYASLSRKLQSIQDDQVSHYNNAEDESVGGGRVQGVMGKDTPMGSVIGDKAFVRLTDVAGAKRKQLDKAEA